MEYVYLIHAIGTPFYKIGYSKGRPKQRLSQIQTGSPHELALIALRYGDRLCEADLHSQFRKWEVRGEWFTFDNPETAAKEFLQGSPNLAYVVTTEPVTFEDRRTQAAMDMYIQVMSQLWDTDEREVTGWVTGRLGLWWYLLGDIKLAGFPLADDFTLQRLTLSNLDGANILR